MNKIITTIIIGTFVAGLETVSGQQCNNDSTGLIPISDLGTNLFNGMQGGLYGNGQNEIPQNHLNAGIQIASQIMPLNAQGNYEQNGKVGFISMGMSNANIFFAGLRDSAASYPMLNSSIVMVNGATGSMDIDVMLNTEGQYWTTLDQKLSIAGITKEQVQVIWFMQAKHVSGIPPNEGIEHIEIMENKFLQAFQYFKQYFPNLKQIYCSGRDYGGYNNPGSGNPEPYAYYTGWAFRKLVERQIAGDAALNYSGANPNTAWLAWADYVWADGKNIRLDGFNWLCPQDVQNDGVHPNFSGKAKVANLLFNFFKSDTTSFWFRNAVSTSLNEIQHTGSGLTIFPNPANTIINVDCKKDFQIYSSTGQLVKQRSQATTQINISDLPSGIYILKIDNQIGRLIKTE
jgi:hypothetical protein